MSPERVDVVVVGAGISGLATARGVSSAGRSTMVLESRSRTGGRLLSRPVDSSPWRADLGATWFWPSEHRVAALVDEFGIGHFPQHLNGDAVYDDPNGVQRLQGNPIDVPSFRFRDGAAVLTDRLASALPEGTVLLDCPVHRIRRTASRATLTVEGGSISVEADHVVLALPPALAADRIELPDELPHGLRSLAAMTPVWMGSIVKTVAVYDRTFWRDEGLSGSAISHLGPLREVHDMSGPGGTPAALFGFAPQADDRPGPPPAEITAQLGRLFGTAATTPTDLIVADWRQADTAPPNGTQLTNYRTFGHDLYQQPALDGRLHWASTETAIEAPGHIEGALQAAERVVHTILATDLTTPISTGANP